MVAHDTDYLSSRTPGLGVWSAVYSEDSQGLIADPEHRFARQTVLVLLVLSFSSDCPPPGGAHFQRRRPSRTARCQRGILGCSSYSRVFTTTRQLIVYGRRLPGLSFAALPILNNST